MHKLTFLAAVLLLFCTCALAQTTSITTHKTAGFIKDPKKVWLNINGHKPPSDEIYQPVLFLWASVDTTDFRKDANGYKYFKSTLYFGFTDQDEFYELPQPVYAGTGNKFRTHSIMWRYNSFYILTNNVEDGNTRDVILYRLGENKQLSKVVLTSNPAVGNYAWLGHDDTHGINYVTATFLNKDSSRAETVYIKEGIYKTGTNLPDSTLVFTANKDIEFAKTDNEFNPLKYYNSAEESIIGAYKVTSNPDYDHKAYLLSKKEVLIQSPVSQQYEKQGTITFSTAALQNAEADGWQNISDLYNRNTTPLFLQVKTDTTDIKTDSEHRKYVKTLVRFGFANDVVGYQLPGSFYIRQKQERASQGETGDRAIYFKQPCLMFTNETFYVFIPNYTGQDGQDATMFTCYIGKGLVKEVLWNGKVNGSGSLPYFTEDKEVGFALVHFDETTRNLVKTFQQNGKWVTINGDLNVYQPIVENTYAEQIRPYFLPLKPVPFVMPPYINEKFFLPITTLSVFTDSKEDMARYKNLLATKPKPLRFDTVGINAGRIIYTHQPHAIQLIPYVPKGQVNYFEQCASYAFASLYKQAIDADWQITAMRKKDPTALKKETDISFFGMQQYFRGNKQGISQENLWMYPKSLQAEINATTAGKVPEFEFDFKAGLAASDPFEILTQNKNQLDSILPNVVHYYETRGLKGMDIYETFKAYLKALYENNKATTKPNTAYQKEINELNVITGIPAGSIDLQKALAAPTLGAFYHVLFFNNCTEFIPMASRNNLVGYNLNENYATTKELICKILAMGKPVFIGLNTVPNYKKIPLNDSGPHAVLIIGYKQMKNPATGQWADAFKLLSNYTAAYDYETNDGWFLADNIVCCMHGAILYIPLLKALKKEWVENTPDYKRLYNNTYTETRLKYQQTAVGATAGAGQQDAEPLYTIVTAPGYEYAKAAALYKKYFTGLGYTFKREDTKAHELYFEGLEVWLKQDNTYIICPTTGALEQLKTKMDFSKIKGKFVQGRFSDGGDYLKTNAN